eukprot:COSAG01_NODE_851_length_13121_cov_49.974044_7_plen_89_part_00
MYLPRLIIKRTPDLKIVGKSLDVGWGGGRAFPHLMSTIGPYFSKFCLTVATETLLGRPVTWIVQCWLVQLESPGIALGIGGGSGAVLF